MTTIEYSRLVELRGQIVTVDGATLEEALTQLIVTDGWASLSEFNREKLVRSYFSTFGSLAQEQFLSEHPAIQARIKDASTFQREGILALSSEEAERVPGVPNSVFDQMVEDNRAGLKDIFQQ